MNFFIYCLAPRSTQFFILPRSIKSVPGSPGDLMVKSRLSRSCSAALRQLRPIHKEEPWSFVKYVMLHPYFLSVLCSVYVGVLTYFVCFILACIKPFIDCDGIDFVIFCLWKDKFRLLQCLNFRI